MSKRALILLGGACRIPERREGDIVICADSGFKAAVDNSLEVDHLVGDMDSIPPTYLKIAKETGVSIQVYNKDKDLSDGEIALDLALELNCENIIISGGKGGRCDHILSTFFLPFISDDQVDLEIWMDEDRIHLIKAGKKKIFSGNWEVVSILPIPDGCIVSTEGLKWPLRSERIDAGSTRGIHNEPIADSFSIECEAGSVFVILSDKP